MIKASAYTGHAIAMLQATATQCYSSTNVSSTNCLHTIIIMSTQINLHTGAHVIVKQ